MKAPARRPRSLARRLRRRAARIYHGLRPALTVQRGPDWISYRGTRSVVLRRGPAMPRRGIFLRGACDAPSMFTLPPLVIGDLSGTLAIHSGGSGAADARSDLLLQTHTGVPEGFVEEVRGRFSLPRGYFEPTLFEPEFVVPDLPDGEPFPKTVVVLSILPDLTRTAYRHRREGYLVDPGATWLNRIAAARTDASFLGWFKETFESVGRMTVDRFRATYRELVPAIREATGAEILVFNTLEIEPNDPTHDYSLRNLEAATRRRRFNIALAGLSRELGFHVVDVDRVLKQQGIVGQIDFSHFPVERMRAVAGEARRILEDLGVL